MGTTSEITPRLRFAGNITRTTKSKIMVTIIGTKLSENTEGKAFVSLKLQGGTEAVQSQQTGKFYLTAKTCYIPSTFSLLEAEGLVGSKIPGKVVRVATDPYAYTIKETGEVISLAHSYEYQPDEMSETPATAKERDYSLEER